MENKKILITLVLTCLITPLSSINAMNNNNYNQNNYINYNNNNQNYNQNFYNNNNINNDYNNQNYNQNYYNNNNINNDYNNQNNYINSNYNNQNNYINSNYNNQNNMNIDYSRQNNYMYYNNNNQNYNQNYYNNNNNINNDYSNQNYNQNYYNNDMNSYNNYQGNYNYMYYNNYYNPQEIINQAETKIKKAENLLNEITNNITRAELNKKDEEVIKINQELSAELTNLGNYNDSAIYYERLKIKNLILVFELCLGNILYQKIKFEENNMKKTKFLKLEEKEQNIKFYKINYNTSKNLIEEKIAKYNENYKNMENRNYVPYYNYIEFMSIILFRNFQNMEKEAKKFLQEYERPLCFEDLNNLDEKNISECLKDTIPKMLIDYKKNYISYYKNSEKNLFDDQMEEMLNIIDKYNRCTLEFHENTLIIKYLKIAHLEFRKVLAKFEQSNSNKIQDIANIEKLNIFDLFVQQKLIKLICKQTKYYEEISKNEKINKEYLKYCLNRNLQNLKYLMNESKKIYEKFNTKFDQMAKENKNIKRLCDIIKSDYLMDVPDLYCSFQSVKKKFLVNLTKPKFSNPLKSIKQTN